MPVGQQQHPQAEMHVGLPLAVLGASWVVISGVISRVTIAIAHTRGFIALLITTRTSKYAKILPSRNREDPAWTLPILGCLGAEPYEWVDVS